MGSPWAAVPSGHIHLLGCGVPHRLQCRYLPHSMGCRGTACFTTVSSRACRGIPAPVPGAPLSLHLLSPWEQSTGLFLLLTASAAFYHFLNMFSPRCHRLSCWAQPCPAEGPLELAGTGCVRHGAALGLSSQRPRCSIRCRQLGTCTQYNCMPYKTIKKVCISLLSDLDPTNIHDKTLVLFLPVAFGFA